MGMGVMATEPISKTEGARILMHDFGLQFRIFYRKKTGPSSPCGQHAFDKFAVKRTFMHQKFGVFIENGLEKGKPHDVVPVGVGKDKMEEQTALGQHLVAESPDTGPCIEDDNIVTLGPDFNAGGITAVFYVVFSLKPESNLWSPNT